MSIIFLDNSYPRRDLPGIPILGRYTLGVLPDMNNGL
jgi:hypothetical protein